MNNFVNERLTHFLVRNLWLGFVFIYLQIYLSIFFFRIEKRSKYSRRRQFHEDADIDYINERNMKFNQKAERYYGQYTKEIRENLERGTAI